MDKRQFLCTSAVALLLSPSLGHAEEELMNERSIVKSLSKDIALDPDPAPQHVPSRPRPRTRTEPSVQLQVQFAFDSAQLTPAGARQLDELGRALNNATFNGWGFELTGHTDRVGDADYNARLSLERALAVQDYLVQYHNIAPQRLVALGLGGSQLADPSHPRAAINRRVEVRRIRLNAAARPAQPTQAPQPRAVFAPPAQPEYRSAPGGRLITTP